MKLQKYLFHFKSRIQVSNVEESTTILLWMSLYNGIYEYSWMHIYIYACLSIWKMAIQSGIKNYVFEVNKVNNLLQTLQQNIFLHFVYKYFREQVHKWTSLHDNVFINYYCFKHFGQMLLIFYFNWNWHFDKH